MSCGHAAGVFIAIGSNLGDRGANIRDGLRALERGGGIAVLRVSSFHETDAVGGTANQPRYLNAAAELTTDLGPRELLGRMLEVEREFGRKRTEGERNGPRTLDLDLLVYDATVLDEPGLTLPHPRMWEREFVLCPLAEICDVAALRRRFRTSIDSAQARSAAGC